MVFGKYGERTFSHQPMPMNDIICFDLGGSSLKYGYGNSTDGLLFYDAIFHKEKSLTALEELFARVIGEIKEKANAGSPLVTTDSKFSALCIASPGIVNSHGRVMGSVPNIPYIEGVNLKDILYPLCQLPVYVENDANMMTLAESYETDSDVVVGITIGSGIGTGLVVNHQIFHGEDSRAMEAGHMIVSPGGRRCFCGKKGCWEAYCSSDSMRRIVFEHFPDTDGLSILKILNHESPAVQKVIRQLLDVFAIALSNLIMILNPGTIVIGGGVIEIESFPFDYLCHQTYENLTSEFKDCIIKKAVHGNKAGCFGGCYLPIS